MSANAWFEPLPRQRSADDTGPISPARGSRSRSVASEPAVIVPDALREEWRAARAARPRLIVEPEPVPEPESLPDGASREAEQLDVERAWAQLDEPAPTRRQLVLAWLSGAVQIALGVALGGGVVYGLLFYGAWLAAR